MAKTIVKKTRVKIINVLLVLVLLCGTFFSVYFFLLTPVKNIVIKNTTFLKDDTILEWAKIKDYPNFIFTNSKLVEQDLEKSKYIYMAKLHKKWGFIFELDITENRPLFYDNLHSKYSLEHNFRVSEDSINKSFRVPRLINEVPNDKYEKLVNGMSIVKKSVFSKISDIEYQPNEYDKDRFLLYMNDGNMVYVTLTKFKMINHYNEVLEQLENHKGILYLDNGNHFQIKE